MNKTDMNSQFSDTLLPNLVSSSHPSTVEFDRRHDLDALRAIAMLLGIVLHTALSFAPIPWPVQDSQQNNIFYVLFAFIHGFRMPLFFMLSGFFTAMLWRKRGLRSLLEHRFKRIFLPLVIGCFTIIPAMWVVSILASQPAPGSNESTPLFSAVVADDIETVKQEINENPDQIDTRDGNSGSTPLCTAVFLGRSNIVKVLLQANADVNRTNRAGSSPLHVAVFMGRSEEAAELLEHGAAIDTLDESGLTVQELLKIDYGTTSFIAGSLGVSMEHDELLTGRKAIAELLAEPEYLGAESLSDQSQFIRAIKGLLFQFPVFMHLWFLWFLCWLVAAFSLYAPLASRLKVNHLPKWFICSPVSLLVVIPLTMIPQSFMSEGVIGPDSSDGLLPIPGVLFYYAIFFFFGALYWEVSDKHGQLGSRWYVSLPVALLIVFPLMLDIVSGTFGVIHNLFNGLTKTFVGNFLQATFAWLMTVGSIGLFRQIASAENKSLRYFSDSSYWLYLSHLPLVILMQWLLRDIAIPSVVKFLTITIFVSVFLLFTYEYGVRYTWIGRLLNGRRIRGS